MLKNKIQDNFTLVPNELFKNKDLSVQARFLCFYLLSLPANWKLNLDVVSATLGIARSSLSKYVKELLNAGILQRVRIRSQKGEFGEYVYSLSLREGENIQALGDIDLERCADPLSQSPQNAQLSPTNKKAYLGEIVRHINTKDLNNTKKIDSAREDSKQKEQFIDLLALVAKGKAVLLQSTQSKRAKASKQEMLEGFNLSYFSPNEQEALKRFLDYRAQRRKLLKSTKEAIINRALRLKRSGQDICHCIERSIEHGWSGLFELRSASFSLKNAGGNANTWGDKANTPNTWGGRTEKNLDAYLKKELSAMIPDFYVKLYGGTLDLSNIRINGKALKLNSRKEISYAL